MMRVLKEIAQLVIDHALTTAVLSLKHFFKPLATLYSPPPSQTLNSRAVLILPSPGSRRIIISPRETSSQVQFPLGLMSSLAIVFLLVYRTAATA
jgi:hypothetical protein